jgi:hypothetical protein
MAQGHDVWQKTFYHRLIQTSLGSALRANYDLSEPLPDRLAKLLQEIDDLDHRETGADVQAPGTPPGTGATHRP